MTTPRYRIGIDIGGTFTDLMLVDDETGRTHSAKTLTTPDDPSRGVETGLRELLEERAVPADEVRTIVHGTTLVTNAIIERKGPPTGLLTTKGFRDVVEIGRESRYDMYDLFLDLPKPLVRRRHRRGVAERILDDGTVDRPLDPESARLEIAFLREEGVEAFAVCLLHSYANPAHERELGRLIRQEAPDAEVTLSSEVAPEIREYERASTTIANVYVQRLIGAYLRELAARLGRLGVRCDLFIMLSSGGIATVETAGRFPVRLVESGPAAGALAAAFFGRLGGQRDLLSFDMGGTTAKICLIDGGEPLTTPEFEVARMYRFKKGSGLPLKVPVIDMIEIGAGGGSIARVDRLGLLKVGPESAGAVPGPACYGRGGTDPTVTDGDLILGYLDPGYFLGGKMALDRGAAERAVRGAVAEPLGLGLAEAAWGVHKVVNEDMAAAARVHAIERGKDARRYPLFAFGGAGPVHACGVGAILDARRVMVPLGAGTTSSLGFLVAPLSFEFARSHYARFDTPAWPAINRLLAEMEDEGRALLRRAGVAGSEIGVRRGVDMRYVNQGHEIPVPLPDGPLFEDSAPRLRNGFSEAYRRLYGRLHEDAPLEMISWRVQVSGPVPEMRLPRGEQAAGREQSPESARKGDRDAYFPEAGGFRRTPVYDRYRLAAGMGGGGPVIIEERDSTTVVTPRARWQVDALGTIVVELQPAGA